MLHTSSYTPLTWTHLEVGLVQYMEGTESRLRNVRGLRITRSSSTEISFSRGRDKRPVTYFGLTEKVNLDERNVDYVSSLP